MEKSKNKILVAVYGTLRMGSGNHRILKDSKTSKYLGTAVTKPIYEMLHLGGFPGVIEGGDVKIKIEVYSVEDSVTKSRLDTLEGYYGENNRSNLYNKKIISTKYGDAEMYLYNNGNRDIKETKRIKTGDWYNRN